MGSFYCNNNQLISLYGAPLVVDHNFSCSNNVLSSLEGLPEYIGGICWVYNNNLTSFCDKFVKINGNFYCDANVASFNKNTNVHLGSSSKIIYK